MMTSFVESTGQSMTAEWLQLWQFLFATFRDGGILSPSTATQCAGGQTANCTAKLQPVDTEVGYTDDWRARIVHDSDNAQRYLVPAADGGADAAAREEAKLRVVRGKGGRRAGGGGSGAAAWRRRGE
jgi:hypothetical protein